MRKFVFSLGKVAIGAAMLATLPSAMATVLNFDDLPDGVVTANYGGLDWSLGGWTAFSTPFAPYTAKSGQGRITNEFLGSDAASLIRFGSAGQTARFDGAYFAGLGGAVLSFELLLNGQVVATSATLDPSATPTFLASGYAGQVDAVRIKSQNHGEFVMDDFSFTQAVPEPQSYALLLAGLMVVARVARRKSAA